MTPLLAQRLRADRSFERLYRRHVGDVYRYSLAVLNNPADAEDVTQTTFLNAYRAFQRGERPRTPQHWLIKIAHNVCRQRFRQASRRVAEVALDENVAGGFFDEDAAPSADDIRRAMSHLAFNQRAALVMRELEGRPYAEIADVLGVTVAAVETLIFRARRALREQLEGSLTCAEAELAISRQLDGRLDRKERGQLRAHLRECAECAMLARRQRAQRVALKAIGFVPLPPGLASLLGGGTVAGATVGAKAAAVIAVGAVATGVAVEGAKQAGWQPPGERAATPRPAFDAPRPDARQLPPIGTAASREDARADAASANAATHARSDRTVRAGGPERAARGERGSNGARPVARGRGKPAERAPAVAQAIDRARGVPQRDRRAAAAGSRATNPASRAANATPRRARATQPAPRAVRPAEAVPPPRPVPPRQPRRALPKRAKVLAEPTAARTARVRVVRSTRAARPLATDAVTAAKK